MSYTNTFMIILAIIILLFGAIQTFEYFCEIGKIDDFKTDNMMFVENSFYMSNNIHNITYHHAVIPKKSDDEYIS